MKIIELNRYNIPAVLKAAKGGLAKKWIKWIIKEEAAQGRGPVYFAKSYTTPEGNQSATWGLIPNRYAQEHFVFNADEARYNFTPCVPVRFWRANNGMDY